MLISQYKGQPVAWYLYHRKITFECFAGTFFIEILNFCYQKAIYLILFKFTVFVSDAYRYLYVNFQSNWINLRVIENFALCLINDGMVGSYVPIGTQCFRKFEKVSDQLIHDERQESFRYHSHGFVYSFLIACTYTSYMIFCTTI